jgi:DNA-binding MarR family transcriptional regulator
MMTERCGPAPAAMEPPDGVDALSFDVFRSLMNTVRLNGRLLGRTMAGHGGHPGQAGVLWALGSEEGMSQRELAEKVHLAPPTVTAMLQKLERSGLIERTGDESDQRVTRLHLTDAGRELNRDLRIAHGTYIASVIGTMSEADRRELARLLGVLTDNITAALERQGD